MVKNLAVGERPAPSNYVARSDPHDQLARIPAVEELKKRARRVLETGHDLLADLQFTFEDHFRESSRRFSVTSHA